MTERTALISCIFRHVTEEAGIEHGKKNLKNDTDFETIPILTINIVMVFCLPFVGPKGIDFTLQSVRLFYSRILIFWLNPKARNIDVKKTLILVWSGHSDPVEELGRTCKVGTS